MAEVFAEALDALDAIIAAAETKPKANVRVAN